VSVYSEILFLAMFEGLCVGFVLGYFTGKSSKKRAS
jgi:hypothetical protein